MMVPKRPLCLIYDFVASQAIELLLYMRANLYGSEHCLGGARNTQHERLCQKLGRWPLSRLWVSEFLCEGRTDFHIAVQSLRVPSLRVGRMIS